MEAIIEKIKEYKIIVICTGLGLLVGGFFLLKPAPQTPIKETNLQAEVAAISKDSVSEKEVKKEKNAEPLEQDLITVDVKGAVKAPGIYDLPVGSRVNDAVQKAGGLTEQADSKSLNLAQKVSDEALVYVPTKGEEVASQQTTSGTASSTSKEKKVNLNKAVWKNSSRSRDWEENELRTLSIIVRQMGNLSRLMNSRKSLELVPRP